MRCAKTTCTGIIYYLSRLSSFRTSGKPLPCVRTLEGPLIVALANRVDRRMTHDPAVYQQPNEFRPERYDGNDAEMRKVIDLVFGFGRRACPGMQFAEGSIFAIVSTILATSMVVPKLDEEGSKIVPEMEYTSGIIA